MRWKGFKWCCTSIIDGGLKALQDDLMCHFENYRKRQRCSKLWCDVGRKVGDLTMRDNWTTVYGFNLEVQGGYNQFVIGLMEDRSIDPGGKDEWPESLRMSKDVVIDLTRTLTVTIARPGGFGGWTCAWTTCLWWEVGCWSKGQAISHHKYEAWHLCCNCPL